MSTLEKFIKDRIVIKVLAVGCKIADIKLVSELRRISNEYLDKDSG